MNIISILPYIVNRFIAKKELKNTLTSYGLYGTNLMFEQEP